MKDSITSLIRQQETPPINHSKNPLRPWRSLLLFNEGLGCDDGENGHRQDRAMNTIFDVRWAAMLRMYVELYAALKADGDQADFLRILHVEVYRVFGVRVDLVCRTREDEPNEAAVEADEPAAV